MDSFLATLFGRPERDTEINKQRKGMLRGAMTNYDQMMSTPLGFIPPAMRQQQMADTEEGIRNTYGGQGTSGFLGDKLARGRNDLLMKQVGTNLDQMEKQRNYIQNIAAQVGGPQAPTGGIISAAAENMGQRATGALGDMIFGAPGDKEDEAKRKKTGGFQVGNSSSPYEPEYK